MAAVRVIPRYGKRSPRHDPFAYVYEDHSWRSHALNRWPRGFNPADAPQDRNEWTRGRGLWYNGPGW